MIAKNMKFLGVAVLLLLVGVSWQIPLTGLIGGGIEECIKDEGCAIETIKSHLKDKPLHVSNPDLCTVCKDAMPFARELIRKNDTKSFRAIATAVCVLLNITQESVCYQAIGLFENAVMSIIVDSPLKDLELCSIVLNCEPILNPILNWNITLPNVPKPPVVPPAQPKPDAPKLRVLHISDLHIDFEYQPGAIGACGQPLCCRNTSTLANEKDEITDDKRAGYWGDYRSCDVPIWLVENMFDYISKNEQIDFVYWTGDLPPHNVWNQTRSDQLHAVNVLTTLFKKYFPKIPIYPTVGNHEAAPCNLYPTPYVKEDNIGWLYTQLAEDWTQTGVPETLKQNISTGAFYTLQLAEGLRLVSLNMNYCPGENFWLYINATDPLDQLKWLAETLQASETANEKVHIIGHIHPDDCLDSWQENFYRVINRYESTVAGLFFGHSHVDEFKVLYDQEDKTRAYAVSYISGSVTTYSYLNPNYRIYTFDGVYENSSYQVLDHENVFLNLTEANLYNKPQWRKEYSAKEAFGLKTLTAPDWDDLIDRMLDDLSGPLVDKLYRYHDKMSDAQGSCDLNCRKHFVCDFKQAGSDGGEKC